MRESIKINKMVVDKLLVILNLEYFILGLKNWKILF